MYLFTCCNCTNEYLQICTLFRKWYCQKCLCCFRSVLRLVSIRLRLQAWREKFFVSRNACNVRLMETLGFNRLAFIYHFCSPTAGQTARVSYIPVYLEVLHTISRLKRSVNFVLLFCIFTVSFTGLLINCYNLFVCLASVLTSSLVNCCCLPDPFRGIGGMAEDHGAPEAGKLPKVWTRGRKETESRQRVSGAKSP